MGDDETEADIVLQLDALATYAERANHWTDDKRLMDAAGVADTIYGAIERIEELEANALANRVAIMRLEARLAKVVKALKDVTPEAVNCKYLTQSIAVESAYTTLAELKGQDGGN